MREKPVTGRCLCGDIRYEYSGAPVKILHCHCESCRRHTSSPVTTAACVARDCFRYIGSEPVPYESSPGISPTHCGRCGPPTTRQADHKAHRGRVPIGRLAD